jgi:hypothetical protein
VCHQEASPGHRSFEPFSRPVTLRGFGFALGCFSFVSQSNIQKQKTGKYSRKCQTVAATPAMPRVLPFEIEENCLRDSIPAPSPAKFSHFENARNRNVAGFRRRCRRLRRVCLCTLCGAEKQTTAAECTAKAAQTQAKLMHPGDVDARTIGGNLCGICDPVSTGRIRYECQIWLAGYSSSEHGSRKVANRLSYTSNFTAIAIQNEKLGKISKVSIIASNLHRMHFNSGAVDHSA